MGAGRADRGELAVGDRNVTPAGEGDQRTRGHAAAADRRTEDQRVGRVKKTGK